MLWRAPCSGPGPALAPHRRSLALSAGDICADRCVHLTCGKMNHRQLKQVLDAQDRGEEIDSALYQHFSFFLTIELAPGAAFANSKPAHQRSLSELLDESTPLVSAAWPAQLSLLACLKNRACRCRNSCLARSCGLRAALPLPQRYSGPCHLCRARTAGWAATTATECSK